MHCTNAPSLWTITEPLSKGHRRFRSPWAAGSGSINPLLCHFSPLTNVCLLRSRLSSKGLRDQCKIKVNHFGTWGKSTTRALIFNWFNQMPVERYHHRLIAFRRPHCNSQLSHLLPAGTMHIIKTTGNVFIRRLHYYPPIEPSSSAHLETGDFSGQVSNCLRSLITPYLTFYRSLGI